MEFESDGVVNPGESVFIFPINESDKFYNVVQIKTGKEGWINKKLVKITNEIGKSEKTFFTKSGKISSKQAEAHIFNNTDETLKIKLNTNTYSIAPHKKETLAIAVGECDYYAYVAGITPTSGQHAFEAGTKYEWQFYMGTEGGKSEGWQPPKKVNARKRTL